MIKKISITLLALFAMFNAFSQCSPSFTYSISPTPTELLNVNYTNTTSFAGMTGIVYYCSIDFGDGSPEEDFGHSGPEWDFSGTITHSYSAPGTYTATLHETILDTFTLDTICNTSIGHDITLNYTPCGTTIATTGDSLYSLGEVVTFGATTPLGTSDIVYHWSYGDGTPDVTGTSVTHTYGTAGYFALTLITQSATAGCSDTVVSTFHSNGFPTCDGKVANFWDSTYSGPAVLLSNISTPGSSSFWKFGDGDTLTDFFLPAEWVHHDYSASGIYTITLIATWLDTLTGYTICTETTSHSIIVGTPPAPPSEISGNITLGGPTPAESSIIFKVWLISYDSSTLLISAIDSATTTFDSLSGVANYTFNHVPTGNYRTKATLWYDTTDTSGYIPTYDSTSLYWTGAWVVSHLDSTIDSNINIIMQYGAVSGGPGFISGDITTGAGKGTSGGVPVAGMIMYLRDATTGHVASYTYTDTTGAYTFSGIPVGSYNIYPESINYGTIPSSTFTITADAATIDNIDFVQNDATLTITPVTEAVVNVKVNNTALEVYPVPVSGMLNITCNDPVNEKIHFTITDVTGRTVITADKDVIAGSSKAQLNLAALNEGIYILSAKSDNINYMQKVTVKR